MAAALRAFLCVRSCLTILIRPILQCQSVVSSPFSKRCPANRLHPRMIGRLVRSRTYADQPYLSTSTASRIRAEVVDATILSDLLNGDHDLGVCGTGPADARWRALQGFKDGQSWWCRHLRHSSGGHGWTPALHSAQEPRPNHRLQSGYP